MSNPSPEVIAEVERLARVIFSADWPTNQWAKHISKDGDPDAAARRYLGLAKSALDFMVPAPQAREDQISALIARVAELEGAITIARDTFQHYGDLHAAKPDAVKAQRNYDLAAQMTAALTKKDGTT